MADNSPWHPYLGWLPAELTNFVGRQRELVEIKRLLATARLVTLLGVGGTGKTRLALRVASQMRHRFRDGARWVDLAAMPDPGLIEYAVAEALGVREHGSRPQGQLVVDA